MTIHSTNDSTSPGKPKASGEMSATETPTHSEEGEPHQGHMPAAPPDSYAFVMNVKGLGAASFELAPGFHLRRATADEITDIKKTLNTLPVSNIAGSPFPVPNLWERPWPRGSNCQRPPYPRPNSGTSSSHHRARASLCFCSFAEF